ncbi:hypothetical protein [Virgisporangium aurantiacum]|uniref:Uncharacterized protein n=1 Tax=Virgisporangium aurantiacum TaxID=175570 RepID=A0A8J3Z349_9ACTN|nr:hypothetical protein [Virgisporangium aurantiacum]GIJ55462.1 hypothetical protein Vau01_029780 [Virgisporangium aurantiacum]
MRGPFRSTVEGVAIGAAAAGAMAVVAVLGVAMLVPGAGTGARVRAGAAVVALAVGAPVDLTVSGTAVPGSERLPVRGGLPVTLDGTVDVMPLGVTLTGVAVLVLLFVWRRRTLPGLIAAFLAFVVGIWILAWLGRGGPVDVERVASDGIGVAFRAGVGSAVSGAALLAGLALGGFLLPAVWRRPIAAVAVVFGGVALLGTVVGLVLGAVHGGTRVAGAALLAGADVLGLLPWSLGVPWSLDVDGPIAYALRDRIDDPLGGGTVRWRSAFIVMFATGVILMRILTPERGWPGAARLGVALAAGSAAVTAATAATATATATVFVIQLPAAGIALRGNVFVAVLVGAAVGTLAGLVPVPPRVRTHGVPPRRR